MEPDILRSAAARGLLLVTLVVSIVLASGFVGVHRMKDLRGAAVEIPRVPLTDDQTAEQLLTSAREFIAAGKLSDPTGSYLLMPCRGESGPPYQGSAYVNFDVPSITDTSAFFRSIITAMAARGWSEGVRPNDHPGGRTLGREGISALFYRNPDVPGRGVLQIYGQCRNMTDHASDPATFVDITAQLVS